MGIRVTLENHKHATLTGTVLVVLASIFWIRWSQSTPSAPFAKRAYYSVDDGRTWFADDVNQLSPFDHDGQTAVRAYVWQCHGKKFVSFLERRTPEAKQKLQALRAKGPVNIDAQQAIDLAGLQVKKPGDSKWCFENDPKFSSITAPACPDGSSSDDLEPVYP